MHYREYQILLYEQNRECHIGHIILLTTSLRRQTKMISDDALYHTGRHMRHTGLRRQRISSHWPENNRAGVYILFTRITVETSRNESYCLIALLSSLSSFAYKNSTISQCSWIYAFFFLLHTLVSISLLLLSRGIEVTFFTASSIYITIILRHHIYFLFLLHRMIR